MSGEHITIDNTNEINKALNKEANHTISKKTGRVDINLLMSKVRKEEKKTKKRKYCFFWFFRRSSSFNRNYSFIVNYKFLIDLK